MTDPVRLQLRRVKGFDLQEASRAVNGLPAASVARPHLFGNPFRIDAKRPRSAVVKSFRGFLYRWTDDALFRGAHHADDGSAAPLAGIGLIILRNRIRANVHRLRGHNLACFCPAGEPCHADVYLDVLKTDKPERWARRYPKLIEGRAP